MEEKQIGLFIRDRRLELGLTQQQLAEKLNITDKAVSKWERCLSCPDITLLRSLADALEVSVTELLAGEREDAPLPAPQEAENAAPDTVRRAGTARRKNGGWRFWLFAAVSAGCLIAAVVLLIVHFASGSGGCLLAVQCVAFGWALCCPLLRAQRPALGFLAVLSLTILPFLGLFVSPLTHLWAYGIALLSVGYLWAVYFLWRRQLPGQPLLALGWTLLLGAALGLAIDQIVWGAGGVRPNAASSMVNLLTGGICFGVCFFLNRLFSRRRAKN